MMVFSCPIILNFAGFNSSTCRINKKSCFQRKYLFFQVLRQTTLPIVSERHQTFQRQYSHVLDMRTEIKFSICSLDKNYSNSKIGIIQVTIFLSFGLFLFCNLFGSSLNCIKRKCFKGVPRPEAKTKPKWSLTDFFISHSNTTRNWKV